MSNSGLNYIPPVRRRGEGEGDERHRRRTWRQVPLLGINRGKIDSRRGVVVPSSDISCDCRHSIKIKPSRDGKSY